MNYDIDPDNFPHRNFIFYKYNYTGSKYDFLSSEILSLTGYTQDEIIKMNFESIILDKLEIKDISCKSGNNLFSEILAEYLIKTKSGKTKLITEQSYIQSDENGNKKYIFGVLSDAAPQRNFGTGNLAVENIKYTKSVYTDFLVIAADKHGNINFVNSGAHKF